jgi:capsular exopolysaccharide synthesis family protein
VSEYPLRPADDPQPPAPTFEPEFVDAGRAYYDDEEEGGLDLKRIWAAIVRRKWLILLLTVIGGAAGAAAYKVTPVEYTAMGRLWVDAEDRTNPAEPTPIRQRGLFESAPSGYLELFSSREILSFVVSEHDLFLLVDEEYRPVFEDLEVDERLVRGNYTLLVGPNGSWRLAHAERGDLGSGAAGEVAGEAAGIRFRPILEGVAAGTEIEFRLIHPVEAERDLREALETSTNQEGIIIFVQYGGQDPERIAAIVNTLLDRHVEVAARFKRRQLDSTQVALQRQLANAQAQLTAAEQELEDFKVQTIALPSEQASPIVPGLQLTRDPFNQNFFEMRVTLDEVRRDRERIDEIRNSLGETEVPVESLETIPSALASRELSQVLTELIERRAELRDLRERYSEEYPPVVEIRNRITTLTERTVPQILEALSRELSDQESRLQAMIDETSSELAAIPARTIREASLEREVLATSELYNEINGRVEAARLASLSSSPDVAVLDYAFPPVFPSSDPRLLLAGGVLLGGLVLGLGGALILDRLDNRVRYPTQVDREMGLTILGNIPRVRNPLRRRKNDENHSAVLESFRELRIATSFAFGSAGPLTLTITSPSEGEGKTFISVNLAVAFAELGRRTLLIDGDTRRGDAHHMLNISRTPGLVDYLAERDVGEIIHATEYPNLSFIPSGSRGSTTPELLASHRMAQFLGTLKRAYDVVIIDAPPLTGGGDALVLTSLTGHMALVLRSGSTDRSLAAARVETLARFPFRILGAIMNDTDPSGFHGYYPTYLPTYLTEVEAEEDPTGASRLIMPGSTAGKSDS